MTDQPSEPDDRWAILFWLGLWALFVAPFVKIIIWGPEAERGVATVMLACFGMPALLLLAALTDDPNDIHPGGDGC